MTRNLLNAGRTLLILAEIKRIPIRRIQMVYLCVLPVCRHAQPVHSFQDGSQRSGQLHGHPLSVPRCKVDHCQHDPDLVGRIGHTGVPQSKIADDQ